MSDSSGFWTIILYSNKGIILPFNAEAAEGIIVVVVKCVLKVTTFRLLISSRSFSLVSLSSWASALSWFKTLIASSRMAGLSVLACLPGSKIELKSWNLQSWGKSVLQNITYCYLHSKYYLLLSPFYKKEKICCESSDNSSTSVVSNSSNWKHFNSMLFRMWVAFSKAVA